VKGERNKGLTNTVPVRFSAEEMAWLDGIMRVGDWPNRAMLIRSLIRYIKEDDLDWPHAQG
jgi:hypothetical protein